MMTAQFTLFYDGQFWCGIYETSDSGEFRATRVVFGPEPTNAELYAWFLEHGTALARCTLRSAPVPGNIDSPRKGNPKRLRREIAKQQLTGTSTKAQQAIKLNREIRKEKKRSNMSANNKAEKARKYEIVKIKKKLKKRGK